MSYFASQILDGIGTGTIYASLALALVLIYRSTGIVNFAQGEMAMLSAFICWQMLEFGAHYGAAVGIALITSFALGAGFERVAIRKLKNSEPLAIVIVTLGLLLAINQAVGWLWGTNVKDFPSVFPSGGVEAWGVVVSYQFIGQVTVLALVAWTLFALLYLTELGLGMRASAQNPDSARLVGIRVDRMVMLGWGLAALVGGVAGIMTAPMLFLEPNMMAGVLVYAFAAATLGGFDSPTGAVMGGIFVGMAENVAGAYIGIIGSELKVIVPLFIITFVLAFRPQGIFGSREVVRV